MTPTATGSGSTSGVGKSASTTTEETQPHVIAPAAASSVRRGRVLKAIRFELMLPARSCGPSTVCNGNTITESDEQKDRGSGPPPPDRPPDVRHPEARPVPSVTPLAGPGSVMSETEP